ncbi:unnamed protein product, partial [Mycena citricolor]
WLHSAVETTPVDPRRLSIQAELEGKRRVAIELEEPSRIKRLDSSSHERLSAHSQCMFRSLSKKRHSSVRLA